MSAEPLSTGPSLRSSACPSPTFVQPGWLPGLLHLGLFALLLGEVAFLRGSFDTDRFLGDERAWARLLLATRNAAPVAIATLAAWILVARSTLAREYGLLSLKGQSLPRSAAALVVHGLVFAGFTWLTRRTFVDLDASFDGPFHGRETVPALAWVGAWTLGALAVPVSAAAVAFPAHALRRSALRLLPSLLLATAIGVGAFTLQRTLLASELSQPLRVATTQLARWMLWPVTGELAGAEPFLLASGSFEELVGNECSGFEGIALTWTFLAVYFVWFRQSLRFPQALLLVPVATLLVWILNGVRLAALVWIGDRFSPEVALQGFHSYAGWIVFCGLSLSVVYTSQRMPWFAREPRGVARAERSDTINPAAVYLGPFLAVLAVSFVTGAFTSGFDVAYPLRVLAGLALLWCVRSELPRIGGAVSATGLAFGAAAFVLWVALERLGVQARDTSAFPAELAQLSPLAEGAWVTFRALGFLLVAPLAEELAFRGFLARRLVANDFEALSYRALTPLAWMLSSLAFGLLHGQWIAATLAGALFALAAMRRGRLADAVVAHVTTNALLVLSSFVFGPWHAWL
jgi:exosortase E/protease (VPEID-CTERM system)